MNHKTIDIEALFELSSVSEPVRKDSLIFFVESNIDKEDNQYVKTIKSYNMETEEVKVWSAGGTTNHQLEISKDHKHLLFLSNNTKDKKIQLFAIPLDGGSPRQLTEEKEGIRGYYQANERSIYYQWSQAKEEEEKEKEEASQTQKNLKALKINRLTYKLDGVGMIPQDKVYKLSRLNLENQETEVIFEHDQSYNVSFVNQCEEYMLYSISKEIDDEWEFGNYLYKYDFKTHKTEVIALPEPKSSVHFLAASPDQSYMLLAGNTFEYAFVTLPRLYLYVPSTGEIRWITEGLDKYVGDIIVADFQQNSSDFEVQWLNNEEFIFPTTDRGKIVLYRGNIRGDYQIIFDERVHLTGGSDVQEDTLAVTYSTTTLPSELALLNLTDRTLTTLYNPNEDSEYIAQELESFTFTHADNQEIHGWYVPPVKQEQQKDSVPAILYIHGGPQVCYGESFFHEMQYLAGLGYGVIMLNPRGSNGYGQEHVAAILGDYGNVDYQDLMAGLDYILEQHPEIDSEQLFVAGGSYGGYMTNWIVGHTQRFAAACTQRSISNWISFYGTSDIGPFFVEFQLQNDIHQFDQLWDMSPIKYAKNIETPLLVIHSEEDLRCPQEQGEQIYRAAKKQRIPTEMMLFPQSNHGLSRNGIPNLRVERLEGISRWFNKYRK